MSHSIPFGYWVETFRKYATFSGRARRAEYWSFSLVNIIIGVITYFTLGLEDGDPGVMVYGLYALVTFIPGLAVTVRRLHDSGRSGWWILISIVPLVNLVMLYFMLVNSQPGDNEYGPNPKGA